MKKNRDERSCSNCRYSDRIGNRIRCMGQRFAPVVFPDDVCDAWKPFYVSNYEWIVRMNKFELANWIHDQIVDRNIGVPVETWVKYLDEERMEEDHA